MQCEHESHWLGYPVKDFSPKDSRRDCANTIYRLASEWDETAPLTDLLAELLEEPASAEIPALIFGLFGEHDSTSEPLVEALVAARERLPT